MKVTVFRENIFPPSLQRATRIPRSQTVAPFPSHLLQSNRQYAYLALLNWSMNHYWYLCAFAPLREFILFCNAAYLGIDMDWLDMLAGTIRSFPFQRFARAG